MLVLEKDTRRAKVKIELDLGEIPAPIASIKCSHKDLCFPTFGGVFVNPTTRLALLGDCLSDCPDGKETYLWTLSQKKIEHVKIVDTFCDGSTAAKTTTTPGSTTTAVTTTITTTTAPKVIATYKSMLISEVGSSTLTAVSLVPDNSTAPILLSKTSGSKRRKRQATTAVTTPAPNAIKTTQLPPGCRYVFGDGSKDARDDKELSIVQPFFPNQNSKLKEFDLKLEVTQISQVTYKGKTRSKKAVGLSSLTIKINDPPENGTCTIQIEKPGADGKPKLVPAKTGRALLDEFYILCEKWVDPNAHSVNKFIFKTIKTTDKGTEMSVLYSGPLPDAKVVLPLGTFELMAEIHEEAGAYTKFQINPRFPTYLPDEADYKAVDLTAMLKRFAEVGDQARVSQILQADASIRAAACWFDMECSLSQKGITETDPEKMDDAQKEEYNSLIRTVTKTNTEAIKSAKDNLQFENVDQLEQGASTLYSITVSSKPVLKLSTFKVNS